MSSRTKETGRARRLGGDGQPKRAHAVGKRKRPQSKQPPKPSGSESIDALEDKRVFEPEPAGEDDHAFFDNEENEGYVNFMLSLDPRSLGSFDKRTKEPVPPVCKRGQQQKVDPADIAVPAAGAPTTSSSTPKHKCSRAAEAVIDSERRHASTEGWTDEAPGPGRLPIKTREGLLKPNERMQGRSLHSHTTKAGTEVSDKIDGGEFSGRADDVEAHAMSVTSDGPSELSVDSDSVYDSADSHGEGSTTKVAVGGVDLAVLRERRFAQKKASIAELCEAILAAPEESLLRPKTVAKGQEDRSRMEQLHVLVRP